MPVLHAPPTATHELGGVRFTSLATPTLGSTETAVWTVEVDAGADAVPHSMTREEVFIVLSGTAAVTLDGNVSVANRGDAIVVPAHVEFTLANAGTDTTLRLVCCLPVGGQAVAGGATFTPPWAE